jgi:intein/homing endonuclease
MYRLLFDDETVIEVTGNHKFLTARGYVRADELGPDDEIVNTRTHS